MKKIDLDALNVLTKALGLTGRGAPVTELTDGLVDQALDMVPVIRRGRTLAGGTGIFYAILETSHVAAETVVTSIDPYKVPATGLIAPYPSPMPAQFDIWLLQASIIRAGGTGTMNALLTYTYSAANQGWGVNNGGAAVVATPPVALAHWDALATVGTSVFGVLAGTEQPTGEFDPFRLPRGVDGPLTVTVVSSAAATFHCHMVLGVFPISLGQDGVV